MGLESSSFVGHAEKPILSSALLNSHSQQVSERVVLLDDLEGPGVRDFGVWGVGKPARAAGVVAREKHYLPEIWEWVGTLIVIAGERPTREKGLREGK